MTYLEYNTKLIYSSLKPLFSYSLLSIRNHLSILCYLVAMVNLVNLVNLVPLFLFLIITIVPIIVLISNHHLSFH